MVHVLCEQKGSGKTKALIQMANEKVLDTKGHVVYIDDDDRLLFELDRRIRLIRAKQYKLDNYSGLFGFLCGILSEDYDINYIFIDGLFNIVPKKLENIAHFFLKLEKLTIENNINICINISSDKHELTNIKNKYSCDLLKV